MNASKVKYLLGKIYYFLLYFIICNAVNLIYSIFLILEYYINSNDEFIGARGEVLKKIFQKIEISNKFWVILFFLKLTFC